MNSSPALLNRNDDIGELFHKLIASIF